MGCDGGTVPKRHELVKEKAAEKKPDARQLGLALWFYCALSKTSLREPVVADALGKLYNRDAVLEYLIDKSAYGDGDKVCPHLTSLKDVVTLKLTQNTSWVEENGNVSLPTSASRFVCPVTLKEMNGRQPFSYFRSCGCVLSDQALREVTGTDACLKCNEPVQVDDVVPLNPPKEISDKLLASLQKSRAAAQMAKKNKKKKNYREDGNADDGGATKKKRKADSATTTEAEKSKKSDLISNTSAHSTSIHGGSTTLSKAASIILAYEKEKQALGVVPSAAVKSLFTSSLKEGRETKESFCNRGSLRQIM